MRFYRISLNSIFTGDPIMYRNYIVLALLLCGLVTTPAFSQKSNPKKIIQAITSQSAQNAVKNSVEKGIKPKISHPNNRIFPNKNVYIDPTVQRRLILQVKHANDNHYKDVMLFHLYDKEYGIIPAVNDFMYELAKEIDIVQNGPALSFKTNSSRKVLQAALSPKTVRQHLLKAEKRLQKLEKSWNSLKPLNFKIASFTQNYGAWDRSWWIDPYFSGEQDIVQVLAFRHPGIRNLYRRIMAWAHGEDKFPFSFKTVSQILELNAFSDAEYDTLYNALNSSGCNILRNWGWTDADIRQFIKIHQDVGQVVGNGPFALKDRNHVLSVAYHTMYLPQFTLQKLEYVYKTLDAIELMGMRLRGWPEDRLRAIIKFYLDFSTLGCPDDYHLTTMIMFIESNSEDWLDYWNFNIEQNQPAVLRVRQQLQENP